jgi:uncharacterized membrane protein
MFEFIICVAAIVIVVMLIIISGNIQETRRRLDGFEQRLRHVQDHLSHGDEGQLRTQAAQPQPSSPQFFPPPIPSQRQSFSAPPTPPQVMPQSLPQAASQVIPPTPSQVVPQAAPQSVPQSQSQPQSHPQQPPSSSPLQQQPPHYQHHQHVPQQQQSLHSQPPPAPWPSQPPFPPPAPWPSQPPLPPPVATAATGGASQSGSLENLFGRNILGVVAAILVFLGLVFLGFLVVPQLTDIVRIILMFLLSTGLLAGGFLLNRRYANNFTKTLLGCGCGAFFISIMVTHLHFHVFNEIVAFSLLLVWIVVSLLLTRLTQSLLVGIITHAGMIISVCAGYLAGLDDSRLLLLMVYQLLATVLICGGNVLYYRKLYRFGLFTSLALIVFSSLVMWSRFFLSEPGFASHLPVALIASAFLVQFLGASFLSYLLFLSCTRLKDTAVQVLLQGANVLLWGMILFLDITILVIKLYPTPLGAQGAFLAAYAPLPVALIVSLLIIAAVLLGLALLRRRLAFGRALEMTTILLLTAEAMILLLFHRAFHSGLGASGPSISYFVVLALLLMAIQRISDSGFVAIFARVLLGMDGALMLLGGFEELTYTGGVGLPIAYLFAALALVYASYRSIAAERRVRYAIMVKLLIVVLFQVALADILFVGFTSYSIYSASFVSRGLSLWEPSLFFLLCSALLFALLILKQDQPPLFFRINEFVIMFLAAGWIACADRQPLTAVLHVLTVLACFAIVLERMRRLARARAEEARCLGFVAHRTGVEIVDALALTALFFALINGLTDWFEQSYSLSLAAMFIALVIVALGFWSRCSSLRLYGLVLVLLSVVKLVTFDIRGLDTLMRVISFIGGGLICFGISALYNFAVKRFEFTPPVRRDEGQHDL